MEVLNQRGVKKTPRMLKFFSGGKVGCQSGFQRGGVGLGGLGGKLTEL